MAEDLTAPELARTLIREQLAVHADVEQIPTIVAGQLSKRQLEQLALPWLNAMVKKYNRDRVRRIEDLAFPEFDHNPRSSGSPTPVAEAREQLWQEGFSLNDGTYVLWGEATAEQHEQRAAEQRQLARTIDDDADRHEWAAKKIRDAGVTCLNDIEEAA